MSSASGSCSSSSFACGVVARNMARSHHRFGAACRGDAALAVRRPVGTGVRRRAPTSPSCMIESQRVFRRRAFHRQKAHLILSAMRHRAAELGDRCQLPAHRHLPRGAGAVREPLSVCHPTTHAALDFVRGLDGVEVLDAARVRDVDRGLPALGGRARRQAAADGGLLPRRTPAPGRADGRQRAGRRAVELRPREPQAGAEAARPRGGRAVVAGGGRDRRGGPPRPRRVGARRRPVHRRRRAAPVRRDARRGAARAARTSSSTGCRSFGAWEDAMLQADPWMAHSLLSAPQNLGLLNPVEIVRGGRAGLPRRRRADRVGRGVRPAGDRLARLRLAPVLVRAARLPRPQPPRRAAPSCRRGSPTWTRRRSTPPACPTRWTSCAATAGCTTSRG